MHRIIPSVILVLRSKVIYIYELEMLINHIKDNNGIYGSKYQNSSLFLNTGGIIDYVIQIKINTF